MILYLKDTTDYIITKAITKTNTVLSKKCNAGSITTPDFKLYYILHGYSNKNSKVLAQKWTHKPMTMK
jgi:hypothetical protein